MSVLGLTRRQAFELFNGSPEAAAVAGCLLRVSERIDLLSMDDSISDDHSARLAFEMMPAFRAIEAFAKRHSGFGERERLAASLIDDIGLDSLWMEFCRLAATNASGIQHRIRAICSRTGFRWATARCDSTSGRVIAESLRHQTAVLRTKFCRLVIELAEAIVDSEEQGRTFDRDAAIDRLAACFAQRINAHLGADAAVYAEADRQGGVE